VSLGRDTSEADVDRLLAALPEVVAQIRKDVGL
jgi:cysteine sulfinate desulfinase/cysteine desulfurase-like protein